MGEFAPILQAYTEVGILGLLAVLVIILIWRSFDRKGKDDDWKKNKIDEKDENINSNNDFIAQQLAELTDLIKKQNETYQEFQQEMIERSHSMNEQLIEKIVDGVYFRVPSNTENHMLTKINNEIDMILQDILVETNASRVNLVQYHNGGKGINKQAFLKMSMTNERIQLNVKPFISEFKDQFRSVLGYFVKKISKTKMIHTEGSILIDDYAHNLREWESEGGISVRFSPKRNGKGFLVVDKLDQIIDMF